MIFKWYYKNNIICMHLGIDPTNFGNDAEYVFDFDRERLLLGNPVNSILITVRGAVRD